MKVIHEGESYPCQFLQVIGTRVKVVFMRNGKKVITSAMPEDLIVSQADRFRFLGGAGGGRELQEWDLIFLLKQVKNWPAPPPPIDLREFLPEECPNHMRGAR